MEQLVEEIEEDLEGYRWLQTETDVTYIIQLDGLPDVGNVHPATLRQDVPRGLQRCPCLLLPPSLSVVSPADTTVSQVASGCSARAVSP